TARDCVMLANFVIVSDLKVAAFAHEILIERIGAKRGARGNLITIAERSPALHEYVWLEHAPGTDRYIVLDDAEFSNARARADHGVRMHSRRGRNDRRRVGRHE